MGTTLSLARVRAHWHHRAGLARPLPGEPDEVIAQTGWLRLDPLGNFEITF